MDSLYDQDLVLWSEQRARALRAAAGGGWTAPFDWANVTEEIETLGRSERHALACHIAIVIDHLMKPQVSSATEPARGWWDTTRRARGEIEGRLEESPSLRGDAVGIVAHETARARALVRANLNDDGEHPLIDLNALNYAEPQMLEVWLPDNE